MRARTVLAISAIVILGLLASLVGPRPERAAAADKPADAPAPVKANMHDFMEALFQGPQRRLKAGMAAEPKDNAGWKVIRSEALTLAEGSNGLLLRKPEKDAEEWSKYSVASRDAAAEVYKAARAKDFTAAKKAYEAMVGHCNACHKKFDEHNHQIVP
ncbi:MAG: cytochrome c [Planctomycetes bacterium]|nr:cytochrome c [Planctomycetota bacterium]